MTDQVFTLKRGTAPLLISIPHAGTQIPADIAATMTPIAREVDDTDWHLERLYAFAVEMGASILAPANSRYVIDLNRPPDGANLYPGRDTTGLCPVDTFNSEPLYPAGGAPSEAQIANRREKYWQPYHDALTEELARLKAAHGKVLLWEAHSIRSHVPRFFDGKLIDFNFGTAGGESAVAGLGREARGDGGQAGRLHGGGERPLQGRLHHATLRRAAGWHSRGPARVVADDVYGRDAAVCLRRSSRRTCHALDAGTGAMRAGRGAFGMT